LVGVRQQGEQHARHDVPPLVVAKFSPNGVCTWVNQLADVKRHVAHALRVHRLRWVEDVIPNLLSVDVEVERAHTRDVRSSTCDWSVGRKRNVCTELVVPTNPLRRRPALGCRSCGKRQRLRPLCHAAVESSLNSPSVVGSGEKCSGGGNRRLLRGAANGTSAPVQPSRRVVNFNSPPRLDGTAREPHSSILKPDDLARGRDGVVRRTR
jgi:hypothetical protein